MYLQHSRLKRSPYVISLRILSIAIWLILLLCLFFAWHSSTTLSQKENTVEKQNEALIQKYRSLAPKKNQLQTGTFNLSGNEKKLNSVYAGLLKRILSRESSKTTLTEDSDTLMQYFTLAGYKQLRSLYIAKNGKKVILTAIKPESIRITFGRFDLKKRELNIAIYATYKPNQKVISTGIGLLYMTLDYDFNNNQAENIDITDSSSGN